MWIVLNQKRLLCCENLKILYIRKVKFGNAKRSYVFYVNYLPISWLWVWTVQYDKKIVCQANFGFNVKNFKISDI